MKEQIEQMVDDLMACHTEFYENGELYTDYPDMAANMIAKGWCKQEWISVKERLPESGVHCILCCDMKRIDGTHSQYVCDGYLAERFKINAHYADDDCATEYNEEDDEYYLKEGWYEVIKNWDDYNSIVIDDTVTHWMPLPEHPKMKGGAE
jgi:hypothetical protein